MLIDPVSRPDVLPSLRKVTGDRLAPHDFEPALTDWDHPTDYPEWQFICPQAGNYDLNVKYSSTSGGASATVSVGEQTFVWKIDQTKSDKDFQRVRIGTLNVPKPGTYTLTVKPNSEGWHPVNLSYLEIKDPVIKMSARESIELPVDVATLHGQHFFLQNQGGYTNIGGWTDKSETASWDQVKIPRTGDYEVLVRGSAGNGESSLFLSSQDGVVGGTVPKTENWETFKTVSLGQIHLKEGIQKFTIGSMSGRDWNPVNLASVTIKPM